MSFSGLVAYMEQVTNAFEVLVSELKNDTLGKRRLNLDMRVIINLLVLELETGFSWLSMASSGGLF
jgi:uncharacterized protein YbcI